jgi:hypothetical protein
VGVVERSFAAARFDPVTGHDMSVESCADDRNRSEPPLWSIGLAVVVILMAPVVLYSLAPTGPLREGDTVFSDGEQRVRLSETGPGFWSRSDDSCLLDPGHPLIIVQPPTETPDGTILAQVQGTPSIEWPFCPSHAEVLLNPRQIYQKPALLSGVRDTLTSVLGQ